VDAGACVVVAAGSAAVGCCESAGEIGKREAALASSRERLVMNSPGSEAV